MPPFWNAPTLVTVPTNNVPPAEAEEELPKTGTTGKLELAALAVARPLDEPTAVLDPATGAATFAEVLLFANAVVPLDARPVLTTPAAD